ncbi:MAG: triose-phosphate isomerase, partial [Anaerolineae bacterium]
MTASEAVTFLREIRRPLNQIEGIDIAVCPTAVALPAVADVLKATKIGVGAQNMHYAESGAYTGELSPAMIKPYCRYVILGHSERRAYYNETDEGVNQKIKSALAYDLAPIVCVGESLAQNEAGETHAFVSGQVKAAFAELTASEMTKCVIAYEPIWAIGTGKSANAAQA